ncbi:MAG TPA: isoprenylcysteine carboxylmethyltransferase family protein, partial [Candidatus Ozemobacteraceae bacterium]|nr:isoprenylcysteine carboxylmethyltransferase family protein [Candidatus Ozemobacteraceae bacterium]
ELLRLWGLRYIGPTTRTREICADRLVTGGPYARVRHPLYLANALKILGLLIIAGHLPLALTAIAFYAVEFFNMIPYEEHFLAQRFPKEFEAYRSSVPAFLPDGSLFASDFQATHTWTEALNSERRTFASTGGLLGILAFCTWLRGSPAEADR